MKILYIFRTGVYLPGLYRADFLWPDPDSMTDGTHYTNHLITETSPTPLQRAQNPVE